MGFSDGLMSPAGVNGYHNGRGGKKRKEAILLSDRLYYR